MGRLWRRRCGACGTELLRTESGSVCPDWQCSACPIGPPGPPPELVRDAQLRAAGYAPASPIRPAMPTLQNPSPPEVPEPPPPKSPAERRADDLRWVQAHLRQLRDEDIRWAQGHLELLGARGSARTLPPCGKGSSGVPREDAIERRGGGR